MIALIHDPRTLVSYVISKRLRIPSLNGDRYIRTLMLSQWHILDLVYLLRTATPGRQWSRSSHPTSTSQGSRAETSPSSHPSIPVSRLTFDAVRVALILVAIVPASTAVLLLLLHHLDLRGRDDGGHADGRSGRHGEVVVGGSGVSVREFGRVF